MHTLLLLVGCGSFTLVEYEVDGSDSTIIAGTRTPVQLPEAESADLLGESVGDSLDVEDGDLAEAHFEEIRLAGVDAPLDFLTSVTISVRAPGLAEEVVAESTGPFAGLGPFALDLFDVDLAPYLETGDLSLPVALDGVTPDMDTKVAVGWTVVLGVTPKGAQSALEMQD